MRRPGRARLIVPRESRNRPPGRRHVDRQQHLGGDPVTLEQMGVLRQLVAALERSGIPYQATGGLAGNVHGSLWPLHDIDLDVPTALLPCVADLFREALVWGPARHIDGEFDLEMLRLELDGVPVDVFAT